MQYYINGYGVRHYSDRIVDLFKYLPQDENGKPKIELNEQALQEYITYQYYTSSETLFKGIFRERPSQLANFYFNYDNLTEDRAIKTLTYLVENSIKESLSYKSADEIGFSLSGGIDSSFVTGVAATQNPDCDFNVFSGLFLYEGYNEWPYIKAVTNKYPNLILHPVIIDEQDFVDNIQDVIYWLEEPCGGPGSFSQYIVYKEASKWVDILLTGEGGDELWLGYTRYLDLLQYNNSILRCKVPSIYAKDRFPMNIFYPCMETKTLEQVMVGEIQYDLPTLLAIDEKLPRAFGIETYAPLLSRAIVEFAKEVPIEIKFKNQELKYILKKAGEKYLPEKVLNRTNKMGFTTPFVKWIQGDGIANEFVSDLFNDQRTRERGIFNCDEILIAASLESEYGRTILGALSLELFFRNFIDGEML